MCKGEKIYRELINVQVYSHKLAVMEDLLRVVLILTEICTREIQKVLGAFPIPCWWAPLQRSENQAAPTGQRCKDLGYLCETLAKIVKSSEKTLQFWKMDKNSGANRDTFKNCIDPKWMRIFKIQYNELCLQLQIFHCCVLSIFFPSW